ncbi:ROK family protein [Bradyrhizobium barranii]|uniref:ROK family protein n=1 Tax=Bradyrhizobium barranii TaxID=2992140 RepID=A0ABY3QX01_9BRAD|nr:ROK family transcriptional regulator [Bradyrhizobium japonicum]UFW90576.1 ROK family protein [Bradyrhizobium japonicum]
MVVRQFNERVVLNELRRLGEASKADLARRLNITQNAAGQIVRELERQQLIKTTGKRRGERGQPATILCLDPQGAYSIGVQVGRRSLDCVLVDFAGKILKARRHECAFPAPEEALRLIGQEIATLRRAIPLQGRRHLVGIGVAIPYNLGSWRRELDIPATAAAAWNDFNLVEELSRVMDVPVFAENDGNAIAVAELFRGHGRELDDFAVVYLDTAVGGGLVLAGNCRRGATGNAADFGLMLVPPSGLATSPKPRDNCDILLNRASVAALIRHLQHNRDDIRKNGDLESAIRRFPRLTNEWLEDCADALVGPLLAISSILDVQAIIIDGNLPRDVIEALTGRLQVLLQGAVPEARRSPALRVGTLGRDAAALGAAILPLHSIFDPDMERRFGQR